MTLACGGGSPKREYEYVKSKLAETKFGWYDVVSYRADYMFSTNSRSKPAILISVTLAMTLLGGFLFYVASTSQSLGDCFWVSWQVGWLAIPAAGHEIWEGWWWW